MRTFPKCPTRGKKILWSDYEYLLVDLMVDPSPSKAYPQPDVYILQPCGHKLGLDHRLVCQFKGRTFWWSTEKVA